MSSGGTYLNSQVIERVVENVKTSIIAVTEDKLENVLRKHDEIRKNRDAWQAPLSIALAFLLTIVTTEPKDAFGLRKETWDAIFNVLLALSAIWTIKGLNQWRKSLGKASIEYLIGLIRNDGPSGGIPPEKLGRWARFKNWVTS